MPKNQMINGKTTGRCSGLSQIFQNLNLDLLAGKKTRAQYKSEFDNEDCISSSSSSFTSCTTNHSSIKDVIRKNPIVNVGPNEMNKQQKLLWTQINRID